MADAGHVATDKILEKLEKDIAAEYKTATEEMQAKLTAYLEKTEAQRQVQESLLKAGKITKQEYSDWCFRHNMMGKRWEEMRDVLASDMHHTNEIAKGIMEKRMPDVYALNGNYATYQIEHDGQIDTGFTLYNHDTAEYLLGDQRQLMPAPSTKKAAQIAANKDMQWNKQKIQSAVLQGVLQGESPYAVAERLRSVGQMNYNSSVRYARTMTTSAQNAGRYEAYRRARDLGVDLTIEWQATLDHRTRHAHRMMHGQRTEVDKPFHTPDGYTIYYPADCTGESTAPQKEIWNCRCTLLSWVKGFEGDTVKSSPKMGDMSFEDWQKELAPDPDRKSDKAKGFTSHRKPATIIPNQTFADGVNAIKNQINGTPTEAELQQAGTLLVKEYEDFIKDKKFVRGEDYADWLADKLSEVRTVGSQGLDLNTHLCKSRSPAKKDIIFAYSHYPRDWVEKSVAFDRISPFMGTRGFYRHGYTGRSGRIYDSEICIDSDRKIAAFHELGHRFESIMPDILKAEADFYNRRTAGDTLRWLGAPYKRSELSRWDKFVDSYIGKDYGGTAYEVASMGFQYAYTEPKTLARDPDMQSLIYGMLLLL